MWPCSITFNEQMIILNMKSLDTFTLIGKLIINVSKKTESK